MAFALQLRNDNSLSLLHTFLLKRLGLDASSPILIESLSVWFVWGLEPYLVCMTAADAVIQQPGRRLALILGNGAYTQKKPLSRTVGTATELQRMESACMAFCSPDTGKQIQMIPLL